MTSIEVVARAICRAHLIREHGVDEGLDFAVDDFWLAFTSEATAAIAAWESLFSPAK